MNANKLIQVLLYANYYFCSYVFSQEKTFEREYTYKASELDSKSSCRVIAINQLRVEILNEIGVYIESESSLKTSEIGDKYSQDYIGNVATISAGVTKFNVLEEKWNGELFWMKAAITINENEIEESLKKAVENKQKVKELENLKLQLEIANKELEILKGKQEIESTRNSSNVEAYNEKIKTLEAGNHFYNGSELSVDSNFKAAILEYSEVIEIQPNNTDAYHNRGIAKASLSDYIGAISDFNSVISIDPKYEIAYYNRGNAKDDAKDYKGAIVDFNKAIKLNPRNSIYYNNRGIAKGHLSDFNSAISDYSTAVELNPMDPVAFFNRGIAKIKLGQSDSGCKDLSKAGELGYKQAYNSISRWCE